MSHPQWITGKNPKTQTIIYERVDYTATGSQEQAAELDGMRYWGAFEEVQAHHPERIIRGRPDGGKVGKGIIFVKSGGSHAGSQDS